MFFEGITEDDLQQGGVTLYDKGEYIVDIRKLEARHSQTSQAQMIVTQFGVIAKLEKVEGVIVTSQVHGSPIWQNNVFMGSNGRQNKVGISIFMQLISAVTGETSLEILKKRFDGESLEEIAEKSSIIVTLKCVAYIGQRNEKDQNNQSVIRNTVGSFKPITQGLENAVTDDEVEEIPF